LTPNRDKRSEISEFKDNTAVQCLKCAKEFQEKGFLKEALEIIKRGIEVNPEKLELLEKHAEILEVLHKPKELLEALAKLKDIYTAKNLSPKLSQLMVRIANLNMGHNQIESLNQAIKANPNELSAYQGLIRELKKKGRCNWDSFSYINKLTKN